MATIIFVHGTNVRLKQEYLDTLEKIKKRVKEQDKIKHFKFEPCFWGGDGELGLGARLNANGASIPRIKQDLELDVNPENQDVLRWGLLRYDPLYEIRLLAIKDSPYDSRSSAERRSMDMFKRKLKSSLDNQAISDKLKSKLSEAGILDVFAIAWQEIAKSSPLREALKDPSEPSSDYSSAIARAMIAKAMNYIEERQKDAAILTDDSLREELVQLLKSQLGDTHLGIGSWLMGKALWLGTPLIENQRLNFTKYLLPMMGDIILYQSDGQKIRELIFSKIKESEPPVILLAHSLGGVACVDLLIEGLDSSTPNENILVREQLKKVSLLVTAGSQSPFLYEIGALRSRKQQYGKPLPNDFPEWLNLYHRRDVLSYIGADVFPKPNSITDVEIDDHKRFLGFLEPHNFLESHSSYWDSSQTWNEIATKIL
jgi:hypothetical protein